MQQVMEPNTYFRGMKIWRQEISLLNNLIWTVVFRFMSSVLLYAYGATRRVMLLLMEYTIHSTVQGGGKQKIARGL